MHTIGMEAISLTRMAMIMTRLDKYMAEISRSDQDDASKRNYEALFPNNGLMVGLAPRTPGRRIVLYRIGDGECTVNERWDPVGADKFDYEVRLINERKTCEHGTLSGICRIVGGQYE